MPIYDIFDAQDVPPAVEAVEEEVVVSKKDRFFSSLTARLLFFVLFLADLGWWAYALILCAVSFSLNILTAFQVSYLKKIARKQWIAVKRSSVCAIALVVSLFSPALGIMVACTYFLMYDKTGIQEVVPSSLQEQFQEFIK